MTSVRGLALLGLSSFTLCARLSAAPLDTNRLEQLTGLKGTWNAAEGVFKEALQPSESGLA